MPSSTEDALSSGLASAGLSDFAELLLSQFDTLQLAVADPDKGALLRQLKALGITKMGQRQRVAALLNEFLLNLPVAAPAIGEEAILIDEGFWTGISEEAAALTALAPAATPPFAPPDGVKMSSRQSSASPMVSPLANEEARRKAEETDRFRKEAELWAQEKERQRASKAAAAEEAEAAVEAGRKLQAEQAALQESMRVQDEQRRAAALTVGGAAPAAVVSFEERSIEERAAILKACGNQSYARGDLVGAEMYYRRVLELLPKHADALNNLAACAMARSPPEPVAALELLEELLARHPRHAKARLRASRAFVMLGRLSAAVAELEAAQTTELPPATPRAAACNPQASSQQGGAAAAAEEEGASVEGAVAEGVSAQVDATGAAGAMLKSVADEAATVKALLQKLSRGRCAACTEWCGVVRALACCG